MISSSILLETRFPIMFHLLLVYILVCKLAHGQLIQFAGHSEKKMCTTLAQERQENTVYFKFSFAAAKDTTINITLSRDIDNPCMKNDHSLQIYMNESRASEDVSCSGSYQVTYSFNGFGMKLENSSKNKSVPCICIDWWINGVEQSTMIGILDGRFSTTGFDVSYSGDNGKSLSSTMNTGPFYQAEIKVPSSSQVKLSPISFKNTIQDDCELILNSTTGFVANDVESIRIVSKYSNRENLEIAINNKTINKNACSRFVNIPKNIPNVDKNAFSVSQMFPLFMFIFFCVVCLFCFAGTFCNITCPIVTRHVNTLRYDVISTLPK